ncbi:MAG TPA: DUF6703 family protein [Actinomycetes bacterium]|nr:DUF6703 family protein [Actinomycetes bacterium]
MTRTPALTAFERLSAPFLLRLHTTPRWLLAVILIGTLLAGLVINGPVGAVLLVLLAAFLGWLAAIGWRALTLGARLLRIATVALLLVAAASRLS